MKSHKEASRLGRAAGKRFELFVRKDLEQNGWTVSKWQNTIKDGKMVHAKNKFRGMNIPMMVGSGVPDYLVFRKVSEWYEVIGVESKLKGKLTKEEKEKFDWYLKHQVFSRILIASKTKIKNRVVVNYKEYGKTKTNKKM